MKINKEEYWNFLFKYFKWLQIKKPLFYNWNIWIRFDLQWKNPSKDSDDCFTDKYFNDVQYRAKKLLEYTFESDDEVIIVLNSFKLRKRKIKKSNFIFKQILNFNKEDILFKKIKWLYQTDDSFNQAIIWVKFSTLNYSEIFVGISHKDFWNMQPYIWEEVFFINITKKIIFHMYDDRWLDIIASDKNMLEPIYNKYNDWILDYDRKKIDEVFK